MSQPTNPPTCCMQESLHAQPTYQTTSWRNLPTHLPTCCMHQFLRARRTSAARHAWRTSATARGRVACGVSPAAPRDNASTTTRAAHPRVPNGTEQVPAPHEAAHPRVPKGTEQVPAPYEASRQCTFIFLAILETSNSWRTRPAGCSNIVQGLQGGLLEARAQQSGGSAVCLGAT